MKKTISFLFLLTLVGCDAPSTIEETGMEKNVTFESEKAMYDPQELASKITLVKFIDPIVPVPDRENIAKLVVENGCVSVQLEGSNSIYTAIFQSNTHLITDGKTLSGVSTGGIHVSLNETFRFNGAIAADIKKLPETSNIPQLCKSMFHTIGDVSQ